MTEAMYCIIRRNTQNFENKISLLIIVIVICQYYYPNSALTLEQRVTLVYEGLGAKLAVGSSNTNWTRSPQCAL